MGTRVRERLTGAAPGLIVELGWAGVSTRVLAERAGVTPGLVHYHFSSLQALLSEAAIGALTRLVDDLGALLEQAKSPEEAVEGMLTALSEYSGSDPMSLLVTETFLATTRDAELRGAVGEVLADFRARLAAWFAEHGVADPEATAAVLAATVDGLLLHRALLPEPEAAATVLRRLVAVRS
ncbi:TetR/AcrR family transcriptional regulator [Allokutzneria sp. A3M-2-11 16]|uniref:TetR/AcrR family transcriptional regulator n=1 Tax=Allokutzneria sp. A3M-2-11 16 TaxID=2962043 RepID=UPI0020B8FD7E|nr:TetR/AcrR family transcriptional regulator [Allokutzneria sp. A3M-2-11 16]MCP3804932.1 TetR/AcrR family transcriptional regulator [Allokutzneria sp. A3M-2-11 16]